MRTRTHRILLVGKSLAFSTALCSFLESLGGRLTCSETLADAASLLGLRRFNVVLSQMQLDDGTAGSLLKSLVASSSSFVLSVPVESTYLWVPAIWNGHDCWGTWMLRPAEFRTKLRELLVRPPVADFPVRRVLVASVVQAPVLSASTNIVRRTISPL